MYHYAGNNPVKYTDPDGRESVYSYKRRDNNYGFSSDCSTLEGATKSLYGLIPFVGGMIHEGINNAYGFKTIDKNTGYEKLMSIASPVLDLASNAGKIADVARITGSAGSALKAVGKIAGWISYAVTAGDMFYNLSKSDDVAVNSFIDTVLGRSFVSNSHDNVAALYYYARSRVGDLINNGLISIEHDKLRGINGYSYGSEVDDLKNELKVLNQILKDTNE